MRSLNSIQIMGNLGSEPELRFVQDGKPVVNFSVAVNEKFINKNGDKVEQTDWFTVTAWGKLAELCNQYLSKSEPVFVMGKVHLHRWDSDKGQQSKMEIRANKVVFLSGKKEEKEEVSEEMPPEDIPF